MLTLNSQTTEKLIEAIRIHLKYNTYIYEHERPPNIEL